MRPLCVLLLATFLSASALAQENQSKPSDSASDTTNLTQEIIQLRAQLAKQQQQLADQASQLQAVRSTLSAQNTSTTTSNSAAPQLVNAALTTSPAPAAPAATDTSAAPSLQQSPSQTQGDQPISFHIGGADFTPGGFLDFTSIFRTTNVGTLGTNFFSVPFNNTTQGNLTESRFTAQNSRISLKVHDKFGKNDVTGYYELDFLGNDAANVAVTANSHTLRQRLYWADVKRGKWEVLGGQSWTLLMPNRVGISPMTSDVFYSVDEDFNYQAGITWTRAPEFRVVYHPTDHWAFAVAADNPDQFGGQGEITYPFAFNSQLATQIDSAAGGTATPNLHPDFIFKSAYDNDFGGKHFHAELAGLLSGFKITDKVGSDYLKHTKEGGGVSYAINYEFLKGIRFVNNAFYSDGGGRYIFGMGPDLVVLPNTAGTDVNIELVDSVSGVAGFEAQVTPKNMFYGYYGGAYYQRNYSLDTTTGATPGSYVGFGWPGSSGNNNRSIQEPSGGWIRTFWKSPQHGTLLFISQAAYVTRDPWSVATGAPKNAHVTMVWLDLRYMVP